MFSMNDTSQEDIAPFLRSSHQTVGEREESETDGTEESKSSQISVPLSKHRLLYLEHFQKVFVLLESLQEVALCWQKH